MQRNNLDLAAPICNMLHVLSTTSNNLLGAPLTMPEGRHLPRPGQRCGRRPGSLARAGVRRPRSVTAPRAAPALPRLSHNAPSRSRGRGAADTPGHCPANTCTRPPTGFRGAHSLTGSGAGLIGRDKREAAGTGQVGGFSETRDGGRNLEKNETARAGQRSCPTGAAPGTGAEMGARPPPRP